MIRSGATGIRKVNVINRRMFILCAAKVLVFSGIVARLFSLQISENKKYLTLSDKNRLREWRLPPIRGDFLDYFGNIIAGNTEVYQLHVIPEEVSNFKTLIVRLKEILNLTDKEYVKIIRKKNSQKPWETIIISENLSWEEFSKLNLYLHELDGAKPVLSISRNYPFKENYTHVLGYVSRASVSDLNENEIIKKNHVPGLRVGKTGLEKAFEKDLIGINGVQRYEVNAYGKRINQLDHIDGIKGKNITLTIDTEVQKLANELLKDKSGSISVMDIYNGDVLALHSSPSFDPNLFFHGINTKDWKQIRENPLKPLINKTISGLYSPGSTIKPLVTLSALENDVITPNLKIRCTGKTELYGQTYHCWKKKPGHGLMSLRNAIKQSCDTYFYEVARRLGVDRLNLTAKKFGLGAQVLQDVFKNEKVGLVPSTKWKKNTLGKGWVLGETLITGIGQGYIQTTPLQLCLMTAQLANGGFKIFPKITVDKKDIATVIGKGGATIREIVELSGAKVDVKDTGEVTVAAPDEESRLKAMNMIKGIIAKPEMNKIYKGKVMKIMEFGAFVNFLGKQDGLVHISELAPKRVAKVTDVVKEGDEVTVKVIGFDRGKVKLSIKQAVA